MLTIMIILMVLKILYDGIGVFYSQIVVSAKNPYTIYREALAAATDGNVKRDTNNNGGTTDEIA